MGPLSHLNDFHVFPHDNIRKTFTVMHNPVFEESDAFLFVLLACIILYINCKQFKWSVFTFVQYISSKSIHSIYPAIFGSHRSNLKDQNLLKLLCPDIQDQSYPKERFCSIGT